ncbi:hypothetical protein SAMN05444422_101814 [Halobiforma haloterrestris]|uniref:Uncharacterized protein n=1 Tax=Natronobacterium haloterrestre TaxID=148448 RepID=A0A1I1DSX2_NATHA|nr:hypothetical protein SAMN05444422_101814 [Halobiforma haloterrestris]
MESGRLERVCRWLAHKLMPGTSAFNVAVARQRAMQGSCMKTASHTSSRVDPCLRDVVVVRRRGRRKPLQDGNVEVGEDAGVRALAADGLRLVAARLL